MLTLRQTLAPTAARKVPAYIPRTGTDGMPPAPSIGLVVNAPVRWQASTENLSKPPDRFEMNAAPNEAAMFQMSLVAAYGGDEPLLKSRKIHPVTVEGVYRVERDSTNNHCDKYSH